MVNKKVLATKYLTSTQREYISTRLGIPTTQLDARRKGVTPEWLSKVYALALSTEGY